jgi:hypothetical protein
LLANRVDQSLLMCLTHPVRQQAGSYRFDARQAGANRFDARQAEPKVRQRVGRFRCSGERLRQQAGSDSTANKPSQRVMRSALCAGTPSET